MVIYYQKEAEGLKENDYMTKVTREFIKKVLRNYKAEDLTTLLVIKELSKYAVSISKDSRYSASEWYDVIFDELIKNEFIYEVLD